MIKNILRLFTFVKDLEAKIVELEAVLKTWRDEAIALKQKIEDKV